MTTLQMIILWVIVIISILIGYGMGRSFDREDEE